MKRLIGLTSWIVFLSVAAFANTDPLDKKKQEFATVHIYRPVRVVGFGWVFNVKVNDATTTKVKNGNYVTLKLAPGKTRFKLNKSSISTNLEAGKQYYFRTSLVRNLLLGKPEIVEVTKQQASKEMDKL